MLAMQVLDGASYSSQVISRPIQSRSKFDSFRREIEAPIPAERYGRTGAQDPL
jgi:hypothetical protein